MAFKYVNKADQCLSFRLEHNKNSPLQKSENKSLQQLVIVVPLVSDLVGNPEDRLCHVMVHLILQNEFYHQRPMASLVKSVEKQEMCRTRNNDTVKFYDISLYAYQRILISRPLPVPINFLYTANR